MKAVILFVATIFYFTDIAAQNLSAYGFDVQHYRFAIEVNDRNDSIYGNAIIKFVAKKALTSIQLDLANINSKGQGMRVTQVAMNDAKLSFNHRANKLDVNFKKQIIKDDTVSINIIYSGIPSDGLIISSNKYNKRTFFADNWPNRAHNWLPCADHPSDKATVDFEVTAPQQYQLIANGLQVEESSLPGGRKLTRYAETVPLPTKIMVIGLAEFSAQSIGQVGCVPVTAWVYADDRKKAEAAYKPAAEALEYMIDNVGPYPYSKLANVQSKTIFGGLENANTIFYFENSVTGENENEALVVHEVAHQWFGNHATETEFAHLWLSEGFATYFTHLYMEHKYGGDSLRKRMANDQEGVIQYSKQQMKPVVDTSTRDYLKLLNPNSYEKGGWVLHMLRNTVGDSIFWKGIKNYYSIYAGKNASTEDFQKVMEQASGKDLKTFFKQWLYTPGHPKLKVIQRYSNGKVEVSIEQQQQTLFEFPLQVLIKTGTEMGDLTKSIVIKQKNTSFSIPLEKNPLAVIIDPQVNLLFEQVR